MCQWISSIRTCTSSREMRWARSNPEANGTNPPARSLSSIFSFFLQIFPSVEVTSSLAQMGNREGGKGRDIAKKKPRKVRVDTKWIFQVSGSQKACLLGTLKNHKMSWICFKEEEIPQRVCEGRMALVGVSCERRLLLMLPSLMLMLIDEWIDWHTTPRLVSTRWYCTI